MAMHAKALVVRDGLQVSCCSIFRFLLIFLLLIALVALCWHGIHDLGHGWPGEVLIVSHGLQVSC
jgi:hypothetical protein